MCLFASGDFLSWTQLEDFNTFARALLHNATAQAPRKLDFANTGLPSAVLKKFLDLFMELAAEIGRLSETGAEKEHLLFRSPFLDAPEAPHWILLLQVLADQTRYTPNQVFFETLTELPSMLQHVVVSLARNYNQLLIAKDPSAGAIVVARSLDDGEIVQMGSVGTVESSAASGDDGKVEENGAEGVQLDTEVLDQLMTLCLRIYLNFIDPYHKWHHRLQFDLDVELDQDDPRPPMEGSVDQETPTSSSASSSAEEGEEEVDILEGFLAGCDQRDFMQSVASVFVFFRTFWSNQSPAEEQEMDRHENGNGKGKTPPNSPVIQASRLTLHRRTLLETCCEVLAALVGGQNGGFSPEISIVWSPTTSGPMEWNQSNLSGRSDSLHLQQDFARWGGVDSIVKLVDAPVWTDAVGGLPEEPVTDPELLEMNRGYLELQLVLLRTLRALVGNHSILAGYMCDKGLFAGVSRLIVWTNAVFPRVRTAPENWFSIVRSSLERRRELQFRQHHSWLHRSLGLARHYLLAGEAPKLSAATVDTADPSDEEEEEEEMKQETPEAPGNRSGEGRNSPVSSADAVAAGGREGKPSARDPIPPLPTLNPESAASISWSKTYQPMFQFVLERNAELSKLFATLLHLCTLPEREVPHKSTPSAVKPLEAAVLANLPEV